MRPDKYILNDKGEPVVEPDLIKWARWMATREHVIAQDIVGETCRVSTIFLGLDHEFFEGPPILWETMIFCTEPAELDHAQERCSGSREQAEAMHAAMVERVKSAIAGRVNQ